jgi:hypothetical protein
VENFLNSIRTNPIGQISNAHVVHADLSPEGAWDDSYLRLAELATIAVDFSKTGVPIIMPPDLRPNKYPSYMEKENGEVGLLVVQKANGILTEFCRPPGLPSTELDGQGEERGGVAC